MKRLYDTVTVRVAVQMCHGEGSTPRNPRIVHECSNHLVCSAFKIHDVEVQQLIEFFNQLELPATKFAYLAIDASAKDQGKAATRVWSVA